jgi:hypothetical protein
VAVPDGIAEEAMLVGANAAQPARVRERKVFIAA